MSKTYTALASTVLGSPTATVTFSSISGSYTDLIVRISAASSTAVQNDPMTMKINTLTTNRTGTDMTYVSTTAASASVTTLIGNIPGSSATANTFGSHQIVIPNYANSSYNKPFYAIGAAENNSAANAAGIVNALLWSSTAAITQLDFLCTNNFVTGSRFDLYGVTHF